MSQEDLPLIGIRDVDEHLNRRRSWNRGFSSAAVKGYEELVGKRAKQLSKKLEEQQQVILGTWFDCFACVPVFSRVDGEGGLLILVAFALRYDLMYDIVCVP